mgnify:FL=1
MATIPLYSLEEPSARSDAPSLRAFLELGFRPLYMAGMAWALIAVALWVYAPNVLIAPLGGIAWHAHEMLWGFIGTIAVGFLMTAGSNWTGINPLHGKALAVALGLWLVARVGFLIPNTLYFLLASVSELAFFALAAVAMMRSLVRSKNTRNYAVPALLLMLGVMDGLYLYAAREGDYGWLMQCFNAGLTVMAMIALLIARRVLPFFAMRATPNLNIPKHTETGWVQLGACAVVLVGLLFNAMLVVAIGAGLAGVIALWQWVSWKPWAVRSNPLLWILYAGYASLGIGLLLMALVAGGVDLPRVLPVHIVAMAGFSVLIMGMATRTALGHLGRPLVADRRIQVGYWLMLAAVAARLLAIFLPTAYAPLIHMAGLLWIAATGLYLWQFVPMLIRPRW